ncbi:hypothetical protein TrVE_jg4898 [Triparma verrucosa]|uniref:peptidylprolyl isomerase n=1 Tax=Triparma verrucosa TaxID=1606542 RepID=A0A9W7EXW4_9STRA|nr:hypothetical protein TrVE_jg4898 [Triparma verrucosa]
MLRTVLLHALGLLLFTTVALSFHPALTSFRPQTSLSSSRRTFLQTSLKTLPVLALSPLLPSPSLAADVDRVKVTKTKTAPAGSPAPSIGELAAIRFKANFGETVIDNIYDTPEPFYTRVGSGGLIRGVELILPQMSIGDRWVLTIPSDLAFGDKGRPASAGKPRIPAGAEIIFDVEMVGLPGKEPELIDLIGDV